MTEDATVTELRKLCSNLVTAKQNKGQLEQALSEMNAMIDELEMKIFEFMQMNGMDRVTLDGRLFYPVVNSYPSVIREREDEFIEWLKARGEDGIYKNTVNFQTLRSWYKQHEDEYAEELADKFLKVHQRISIGVRNGK